MKWGCRDKQKREERAFALYLQPYPETLTFSLFYSFPLCIFTFHSLREDFSESKHEPKGKISIKREKKAWKK